jgi:hypothetical protein
MNQLFQFIAAHSAAFTYGGLFALSAVGTTMPEPNEKSGNGYRWLYGILHFVVGNIGNVFPAARAGNGKQAPPTSGTKYSV